jgi:hypothetical protein
MHLTLKKEATKPAAANVLQQQARFDTFLEQFNRERPHQALGMKVPADVYTRSPRVYRGLGDLTYPFHDQTIAVTRCGRKLLQGTEGESQPGIRRPERRASPRWATTSGSSPSCTTTSVTLTMKRAGSNRSTISSGRKCYLCAQPPASG